MGRQSNFLVRLGDCQRQKIMTYDAIVEAVKEQLVREADKSDEDKVWIHKGVENHRKIGNKWEVLMRWEDESESWEPIGLIAKSDPVSLAKYAEENNLLDLPGWKRFRTYVKNKKKFKRMMKQVRMYSMRHGPRIKFGVRVPKDYIEAMEFDRKNQNNLWKDAVNMEMKQVYEYDSFRSKGKKAQVPKDHVMIRVHLIFDVKQDGRHKARLVAGGHLTGPKVDTYYSSVVSLRSMRIVIFLSELNELELCSGDIGNAYLEAYTKEKVCFIGGKEFAPYGHEGHLLIIVKALYGLKTSGARFHEKFGEPIRDMGFHPSKADSDVWMKNCESHYEYVVTYVDDLLYCGKDAKKFYSDLQEHYKYKLKGVGHPTYHLGGDFKKVKEPESVLTWGALTYVKRMLVNYENTFGEPVPKREVHAPLTPNDHPELDDSSLLDMEEKKIYWTMIGELQWAVALGRIDIICATVTMARFRPAPRRGHLDRLKRIYCFLRNYKKTAIKFNVEMPDYSMYNVEKVNWGSIYYPCGEEIPTDMPVPKGKPVMTTSFVDANLLHCITTGRSCTGIIHLLNKTPIEWFSKHQNTVETATYGSEFVVPRTVVDQILDLRYAMFGDNLAVVNSATIPSGKLQTRLFNSTENRRKRKIRNYPLIRAHEKVSND